MILQDFLKNFIIALQNLIAPPFCSFCKQWLLERQILCAHCKSLIKPVVSKYLPVTQSWGVTVYALAGYQDPLKSLIKAKHYSDRIAARELAHLIWQMSYFKNIPCDYLIPIPLHWTRYAWRGFNQADEMASVLGTYRNVSVVSILKRARYTKLQAFLTREQRAKNVKEAFVLKSMNVQAFAGKHLVLVDDLMTTGATLQEAARVLKTLKPASITAVVACRVLQ